MNQLITEHFNPEAEQHSTSVVEGPVFHKNSSSRTTLNDFVENSNTKIIGPDGKLPASIRPPCSPTQGQPLPGFLISYIENVETTTAIAARFGISASTLSLAAKKAGLRLRGRGCRRLLEPKPQQKEMLSLIGSKTLGQIGGQYGVSKQYVSQLTKRWNKWMDAQTQDTREKI